MILLFSFILLTNDLVIDFMHRERSAFAENIVIDHFLGSLITMPAIVLTWYLIEQRIGRRWSHCIILNLNFVVLIAALIVRMLRLQKLPWLNVTLSMLSIMLATTSNIITILQTIELSPTRFRLVCVCACVCVCVCVEQG